MRNHLVSLHRCFLSLLLACSTYITFYIQVWILRRFFSCPSHNLFFFFHFPLCSECLHSEQKCGLEYWWMDKSFCHFGYLFQCLWRVLDFLLTGKILQVLPSGGTPGRDVVLHITLGLCSGTFACPGWVYISRGLSPPLSALIFETIVGPLLLDANAVQDLERFAVQKALSQNGCLLIKLE